MLAVAADLGSGLATVIFVGWGRGVWRAIRGKGQKKPRPRARYEVHPLRMEEGGSCIASGGNAEATISSYGPAPAASVVVFAVLGDGV